MSDDNSAPEENANRLNPLKLAKRKKMCVYRLGTDMNGLICAVAVIRWAVGKWERSKKRWWQDWSRVNKGLDRDLKVGHLKSPGPLFV